MHHVSVPKKLFEQLISDQLQLEHMLEDQLVAVRNRIKHLESAKTLLTQAEAEAVEYGRIMASAHALCPFELTAHMDRMRWMADFFVANASSLSGETADEKIEMLTVVPASETTP